MLLVRSRLRANNRRRAMDVRLRRIVRCLADWDACPDAQPYPSFSVLAQL